MSVANQAAPRKLGARARAIIIGAIFAALAAVVVTFAEVVISVIKIGYLNFPPAALGILMIIVAINRGIKWLSGWAGLDSSDLLVIYSMVLVGVMVSSHGVAQKLVPELAIPNQFADNSNNWAQLFYSHIKTSLMPWDTRGAPGQEVISDYYNKLPRGGEIPWGAWITPLLTWGVLIALILGAFMCMTAILRRQWVDNEKLAFPLAQLPMDIAADEEKHVFWKNKVMWLGALLPTLVFGLKGLHQLYPTVPDVTLQWNLTDYLNTLPWTSMSFTVFLISFAAIGFFYLLPTDVLFSIWFFFVLSQVLNLVGTLYDWPMPGMPQFGGPVFVEYQTVGAYIALVGYFIWIARPHLRKVVASAFGDRSVDDSDEILSYPVAFWGLVVCVLGGAAWLIWAGMSWWLALLEIIVSIFVISLVMARTTAEGGMLMTETSFSPSHLYRMFAPMHKLGAQNLTVLALYEALIPHDQRVVPLTGMLDSARMADGTRVRRRSFAGIWILGIVIALVVSIWWNIYEPYTFGATNMDGWLESGASRWVLQDNSNYFSPQSVTDPNAIWQMPVFFVVGIVVTAILTALRATFFWWPLHPLGYVLMGTWSSHEFWFAALIAWILKSLSVRYGGMNFYTKARPFFLGMVIGEFGMAVFFGIVSFICQEAWHISFKVPFPWS